MATFFDGNQTYTWTGYPVYGKLTGDVSRSGNTVTLSNMVLTLWASATVWGSDNLTFTVNGTATGFTATGSGSSLGSHGINSTSKTVGGGDTSTSISWSTSDGFSGSFTVTFPSGAPSGLALSNIVPGTDSFAATVSVTGWNGGTSANRYRELSVCTGQSASQRKLEKTYGDTLSSALTVNNETATTSGTAFTITLPLS